MYLNTLVLINSSVPQRRMASEYLLPYLEHFGVPYTLWDIQCAPIPADIGEYALIVIGHPKLNPRGHQLSGQRLQEAVKAGVGLVSFDPYLPWETPNQPGKTVPASPGTAYGARSEDLVTFLCDHPITARHHPGDTIQLKSTLQLAVIDRVKALLSTTGGPLLGVSTVGKGRVAQWAAMDWMDTRCLGPLGGLDDVLWRSLTWAARKPFVLRGLPPLVTMRVDDVAGTGHLWEQSPLWWVHTANRFGFKPWLGIFPFNLTETAIQELRDLLLSGNATAFPHAFGRPVRSPTPIAGDPCPFYESSRLPLRAAAYDEFIYFDHEHARPWTDEEAKQGLTAIDTWYADNAPLPMSRYAICHWGEMGSNTIPHIRDRWGCDFIATYHGVDAPLEGAYWLPAGPFRQYETPGSALFNRAERGDRPMYYADFINFAERQFFLCCTEVRDETGYEWAPDGDAVQSAGRGLRQLQRALDSFALPVLFTHETDYIYKISPEAWEAQLALIADGIASYQPVYVTPEEALRIVRATKTSRLTSAAFDASTRQVTVSFAGNAEVDTGFYLFGEEDGLEPRLVKVPPFQDGFVLQCESA